MQATFFRLSLAFALVLLNSPAHAEGVSITKSDLVEVQPSLWAAPNFVVPNPNEQLPIVGASNTTDGGQLLRIYAAQRQINGFEDVIYDNRDRAHSQLDQDKFPRLAQLNYGIQLMDEDFDYGLAGRVILPAVVFGNSSTALRRGPQERSLPRLAMTSNYWRATTPLLYANNHIYVYPEHRDYDAADRFPVNWPYMITSVGSSGSDQPFLHAIAMTLAALQPDTFAFLKENGLTAPTIQMLLRQNLEDIETRENYFSGAAHPAAFLGRHVQTGRMIAAASQLRPDNIPPVVHLRVIDETFSNQAGLAGLDERLIDSPAAIGRLWRNFEWEREITITTENTVVPNDLPVTFEWHVLRGDPARIKIERLDPQGRTARIRIAWHDPWIEMSQDRRGRPVKREMSRVDIGVFASNGVHDSAPSFFSVDFPEHQDREYTAANDGTMQLSSIDYDTRERSAYFDPMLYWRAEWSDVARRNAAGELQGWDRTYTDDPQAVFVPANDDESRAQHELVRNTKGVATLKRITN